VVAHNFGALFQANALGGIRGARGPSRVSIGVLSTLAAEPLLLGILTALLVTLFPAEMLAGGKVSAGDRGSDLVRLADYAPDIRQDLRYATSRNFMGRRLPGYRAGVCWLRAPVARALKRVQAYLARLRPRFGLKVYDCYRPMRAVRAMVRWVEEANTRAGRAGDTAGSRYYFPSVARSQLIALKYISSHSAHATGIAVDLTLMRLSSEGGRLIQPGGGGPVKQGKANIKGAAGSGSTHSQKYSRSCRDDGRDPSDPSVLDMGTAYDCFDRRSHTRADGLTAMQLRRREILVSAMEKFGFRNYRREWWHFTYQDIKRGPARDVPVR